MAFLICVCGVGLKRWLRNGMIQNIKFARDSVSEEGRESCAHFTNKRVELVRGSCFPCTIVKYRCNKLVFTERSERFLTSSHLICHILGTGNQLGFTNVLASLHYFGVFPFSAFRVWSGLLLAS